MEIIKIGSDILRQKCESVNEITEAHSKLAGEMFKILDASRGVGLAGPQIGVPQRIFVIRLEGDSPRVFINPSLLETSEETALGEEGCLSIPGVWAELRRPKRVKVQAWNEKGRPFSIEAQGILARAILHEYDHLEGILFVDRLSELKRERLMAKYSKLKKNQ
ncbi:MAG: peptide deformylase [Termitinemataceae bacterium]|jgi:peptide deformylase|nr:MAG: peptide deformylase [Termitinemataceae bacterium]